MRVTHNNMAIPENRIPQNNTAYTPGQQMQTNFGELFNQKISEAETAAQPLQFSKHASMRLNAREIRLSSDQIQRVENGVEKARNKGIKDSLVMVDNVALVVNVKNKMVVTAMNQENENIFTNIDGAVIV